MRQCLDIYYVCLVLDIMLYLILGLMSYLVLGLILS